jgi:hypothetical protein
MTDAIDCSAMLVLVDLLALALRSFFNFGCEPAIEVRLTP